MRIENPIVRESAILNCFYFVDDMLNHKDSFNHIIEKMNCFFSGIVCGEVISGLELLSFKKSILKELERRMIYSNSITELRRIAIKDIFDVIFKGDFK